MFVVMREQIQKTRNYFKHWKELTLSDFSAIAADISNNIHIYCKRLQFVKMIKPLANEVHWFLVTSTLWSALLLANYTYYPANNFKTTCHRPSKFGRGIGKRVSKGLQRDFLIYFFPGCFTLRKSHKYLFSQILYLWQKKDSVTLFYKVRNNCNLNS